MRYVTVFVTVPDRREAKRLARTLVGERLAACVQISGAITSVYRWKGGIENAKELLLTAKTKKSLFKKLAKRVRELHSYEVPEITALDIAEGSRDYLGWIGGSTK
ncbi:MAG: divalent-cation tolerance protein CutA [Endomicrobiales bacterium]|nr:divalent-cation tolerance protein CutA [Endomicrobiales bacterium]